MRSTVLCNFSITWEGRTDVGWARPHRTNACPRVTMAMQTASFGGHFFCQRYAWAQKRAHPTPILPRLLSFNCAKLLATCARSALWHHLNRRRTHLWLVTLMVES